MANNIEAPVSPWTRRSTTYLWPTPETEQSEVYQALSYRLPHQSSGRNPSGWMTFLAAYRKRHPKPKSLREGAALVKSAGAEYRKMRSNPHKMGYMGFVYAGIALFGLKMLSNRN